MAGLPTHEATPGTDEFIKGLWRDNPVFVQVLGMCPALAVSNTARNALAMGLATLFVLLMSNLVISSLRRFVPREVRIATYILIIATFVAGGAYTAGVGPSWIHEVLFYITLASQVYTLVIEGQVLTANERLMTEINEILA